MIVTIGEALIDFKGQDFYFGGGPLNTALTIARLGSPVSFLGGISKDEFGSRILNYLIDNCIMFDPVFCNDSAPTMTAKAVCKNGVNTYEFSWKGTSAFSITAEKLHEAFSVNSDIKCVYTGSVSFTKPETRKEIIKGIESLTSPIVFFDPNIRTTVIEDFELYKKDITDFAGKADIVKASDDDLEIWGYSADELLKNCKEHLCVTHGENGSTWYTKSKGLKVDCPASKPWHKIVDTIGCGDVFNGAILSWLSKRNKFENFTLSETEIKLMVAFASECAAYNCTREGCNPPYNNEITA